MRQHDVSLPRVCCPFLLGAPLLLITSQLIPCLGCRVESVPECSCPGGRDSHLMMCACMSVRSIIPLVALRRLPHAILRKQDPDSATLAPVCHPSSPSVPSAHQRNRPGAHSRGCPRFGADDPRTTQARAEEDHSRVPVLHGKTPPPTPPPPQQQFPRPSLTGDLPPSSRLRRERLAQSGTAPSRRDPPALQGRA